jgi:probable rRNA maturation factor
MIEINNFTSSVVDKAGLYTVAKKVLKGENRETETLSLAFINKSEIKKLNKKFRKKNKATDVLSFELSEKGYLGEIVICPEVVKENAKKYGVSAKEEMLKVFVHGILHLLGYDHEKSETKALEMDKKQERYLASL